MQGTTEFLSSFTFDGGLLQLSVGEIDNALFYPEAPVFNGETPKDADVYFGPAQRRRKGSEKKDVLGSRYLWTDCDDPVEPDPTFPASAGVWSGHGHHLYWELAEPLLDNKQIEVYNRVLIEDIPTADKGCWNVNRLLRVPGTWNVGDEDEEPTLSELRYRRAIVYQAQDFDVLAALDDSTRRRIRNGSATGYQSRSERDWAVVRALVVAGARDGLIELLFQHQPIGDKYRDHEKPDHYLSFTIEKVRADVQAKPPTEGELPGSKAKRERRKGHESYPVNIVEKDDGYYMVSTTSRRISTFTLEPQVLLSGTAFDAQDAVVCTVQVGDRVWENVTLPKQAFTSVAQLDKHLPNAHWHWLGHDADVRQLLPFLMDRLQSKGMPHVTATPTLGYHVVDGRPLFLGDRETLAAEEHWEGTNGPLSWLPTGREHPQVCLTPELSLDELSVIREYVPRLNEPCVVWSLVGWYAAACLKPWLEQQGYRFPILNVTGTKGSGKTTLRERVMAPLFGQPRLKSYDAGTTRFVKLALLGSTNAIPIAFSEFRVDSVGDFTRTILMAYDTGHDPRGRADQTTVDYPLSAPFSVDGEDVIQDAAARERIVVARLRPDTIAEGSDAYGAFAQLRERIPATFGGYYIQRTLVEVVSGNAVALLAEARRQMFAAFPNKLPDRIRNNYTVALFGSMLFSRCVGLEAPGADTFRDGVSELVSLASGRSRSLVDDFAEAVVNQVRLGGHTGFIARYDRTDKTLYFQMATAHPWWLKQRRSSGQGSLQLAAILAQLREAPYSEKMRVISGVPMYGVNLPKAQKYGLDVPDGLVSGVVEISLG